MTKIYKEVCIIPGYIQKERHFKNKKFMPSLFRIEESMQYSNYIIVLTFVKREKKSKEKKVDTDTDTCKFNLYTIKENSFYSPMKKINYYSIDFLADLLYLLGINF